MLIEKENLFVKKKLIIQFPYGNCLTIVFLMATTKFFPSNFEIGPNIIFVIFFQPQIKFSTQTNFFEMKLLHVKFFLCVYCSP